MRPVLVGEQNTRSADPRYALYPLPAQCAGGRLARILGLSPRAYLRVFDRVNLLTPGRWSAADARASALRVRALLYDGSPLVLLGSRVCAAFGVRFAPFEVSGDPPVLVLPHPSGRSRLWNDPDAKRRARAAVAAICPWAAQLVA